MGISKRYVIENQQNILEKTQFLRIGHIVSIPQKGTIGVLPISATTWWNGVKKGIFPQPVNISDRCTVWRTSDIKKLVEQFNAQADENNSVEVC